MAPVYSEDDLNVTTLSVALLLPLLSFPSFALVYFLALGPNATISFLYCFWLVLLFYFVSFAFFLLFCFPLPLWFTLNFHAFPFSCGCSFPHPAISSCLSWSISQTHVPAHPPLPPGSPSLPCSAQHSGHRLLITQTYFMQPFS